MTTLFKYITIFILTLSTLISFAEERPKPRNIKEFTDPASPSFVPVPYPKSKKDVITDLEYAIEKLYIPKENRGEMISGPVPPSRKILPNLLSENPVYKYSKIMKVKNLLAKRAFDYFWLIIITDTDDNVVARVILESNGLFGGTLTFPPERKPVKSKDEELVIMDLSKHLGRSLSYKDIKRMEAIALPPGLGTLFVPAYEISLRNGDVYYYSSGKNLFYKIKKKIPWKKDHEGKRPNILKYVHYSEIYAYDQIDDQVLVFEELND